MPALIIPNVTRNELPPGWASLLMENAETYRVTIEPAHANRSADSSLSLAMALRGMEDEPGPEYTNADLKESFKE